MAIAVGPFLLSMPRLLLFVGIAAALFAAWWLRRSAAPGTERALWTAFFVGFIAARLAYIATHLSYFTVEPLSALMVWQGGFVAPVGAGVALVTAIALSHWRRLPVKPVIVPMVVGIATWGLLALALDALERGTTHTLPDLVLETLGGESVRLTDFQGRPVVINLWATWCPPCRREMPALAAADAAHPGVDFLYINQREERAVVLRFLEQEGLELTHMLQDPFGHVADEFRSPGLPTTLFFDADGRLVATYVGELSRPRLADALRQLDR